MRLLIGVLGVIAATAGVVVVFNLSRTFTTGGFGVKVVRAVALLVGALVMVGGSELIRGAVRGRIAHRRTGVSRHKSDSPR